MVKGNNVDGWPHFSIAELACPHCGEIDMDFDFMDKLEYVRTKYNRPMVVTSGYRCPEYNNQVSDTGLDGPHTTGKAVDIHVYGRNAHLLIWWAFDGGFQGIGVHQRGPYKERFVHFDTLEGGHRPWIWTY